MTVGTAECALAASGAVSPESTQQAIGYPSLFLLVLLGALVPVVPTGAVVSSAAAVAFHHSDPVFSSLMVLAVSAAAAFGGDAALYAVGARGVRSRNGSRLLDRMRGQVAPEPLARAQDRLARHGSAVLLVSRLLPGGRIPVMLACLLARMPLPVYLRGNLPAVLGWAATYQLLGTLGGALFPHPWQGVAAAVALTVIVAAAPVVWRRLRPPPPPAAPADGRPPG
ncbi:VTT domain-containing protein [Streptomyces sp. DSM 44917]|uniref:VTT domain-containing protein n=1 Tax=Streptomyces boetiae TaxID=3075541 RepID=A0ABU2L970_9ACTN|nr:VTT domain-containing protein [Streptomyces sp. DSM 44917]MDT0307882.1 VTT domain-containing protein [Streptomyces sp. DSM 44917]